LSSVAAPAQPSSAQACARRPLFVPAIYAALAGHH